MKFFALFLSLTFSTMAFSNSILENTELKPDKRIEVDMYVTATNGCRFHVSGWIDVSFGWNGVSVDGYDITAEGPCGDYTFQGMVAPPPGNDPDGEIDEETLIEIVTNIINENLE